jgi:hypothetical protein
VNPGLSGEGCAPLHGPGPDNAAIQAGVVLLSDSPDITAASRPDEGPRRQHWLVRAMEESSIYQAILETGRGEGPKQGPDEGFGWEARLVIRLGTARFGPPDPCAAIRILEAITDRTRIGPLADRLFEVSNWEELFEGP